MASLLTGILLVILTVYTGTALGNHIPENTVPNYSNTLGHWVADPNNKKDHFGNAFDEAGAWTTALCLADSDSDGFINGHELGDPCCTWQEGDTPEYTQPEKLGNPGDPAVTPATTPCQTTHDSVGTPGISFNQDDAVIVTWSPALPDNLPVKYYGVAWKDRNSGESFPTAQKPNLQVNSPLTTVTETPESRFPRDTQLSVIVWVVAPWGKAIASDPFDFEILTIDSVSFGAIESSYVAGVGFNVSVNILDKTGAKVMSPYTVTLSVTDATVEFTGTVDPVQSDAGVATFTGLMIETAGSYSLTASVKKFSENPKTATSSTFDVVPNAPKSLAFMNALPISVVSQGEIDGEIAVVVKDEFGNAVTAPVQVQITSVGGLEWNGQEAGAAAVSATSDSAGVANFTSLGLRLRIAGETTLTATSDSIPNSNALSSKIEVVPGPAIKLLFSQNPPSQLIVETAISPAVTVSVVDKGGNLVKSHPSIDVTLTVLPTGSLLGTQTVSTNLGIATFTDLKLSVGGTGLKLAAAASGLVGTTSSEFESQVGAPSAITMSAIPAEVKTGQAFTITVKIVDSSGYTVYDSRGHDVAVSVVLSPNPSDLDGTKTVQSNKGVATFTVSVRVAGDAFTIKAIVPSLSLPEKVSNQFKAVVPPVVCGDGILSAGEGCDDGGVAAGDGCSPTCTVEFGWTCDTSGTGVTPCSVTPFSFHKSRSTNEGFNLHWTVRASAIDFGIVGDANKWLGLGFSPSGGMIGSTAVMYGSGLFGTSPAFVVANLGATSIDGPSCDPTLSNGVCPYDLTTAPYQGAILQTLAATENNKLYLRFTLDLTNTLWKGVQPGEINVIWAIGSSITFSTHAKKGLTKVDLFEGSCVPACKNGGTCNAETGKCICPSTTEGDSCENLKCGNNRLDPGEECDYTAFSTACVNCKVANGWSCNAVLRVCTEDAKCGNGVLDGAEQCDLGGSGTGSGSGSGSGSGASNSTTSGCSFCLITPGYVCSGAPSVCRRSVCGDCKLEALETCDDCNQVSGDGCSPTCRVETGWKCALQASSNSSACSRLNSTITPPTPSPVPTNTTCGNGKVTGTEICDDGNSVNGDGCSSSCQIEFGYTCAGAPSVCTAASVPSTELPPPLRATIGTIEDPFKSHAFTLVSNSSASTVVAIVTFPSNTLTQRSRVFFDSFPRSNVTGIPAPMGTSWSDVAQPIISSLLSIRVEGSPKLLQNVALSFSVPRSYDTDVRNSKYCLAFINTDSNIWECVDHYLRIENFGFVTGSTSHFTTFGIVYSPLATPSPSGSQNPDPPGDDAGSGFPAWGWAVVVAAVVGAFVGTFVLLKRTGALGRKGGPKKAPQTPGGTEMTSVPPSLQRNPTTGTAAQTNVASPATDPTHFPTPKQEMSITITDVDEEPIGVPVSTHAPVPRLNFDNVGTAGESTSEEKPPELPPVPAKAVTAPDNTPVTPAPDVDSPVKDDDDGEASPDDIGIMIDPADPSIAAAELPAWDAFGEGDGFGDDAPAFMTQGVTSDNNPEDGTEASAPAETAATVPTEPTVAEPAAASASVEEVAPTPQVEESAEAGVPNEWAASFDDAGEFAGGELAPAASTTEEQPPVGVPDPARDEHSAPAPIENTDTAPVDDTAPTPEKDTTTGHASEPEPRVDDENAFGAADDWAADFAANTAEEPSILATTDGFGADSGWAAFGQESTNEPAGTPPELQSPPQVAPESTGVVAPALVANDVAREDNGRAAATDTVPAVMEQPSEDPFGASADWDAFGTDGFGDSPEATDSPGDDQVVATGEEETAAAEAKANAEEEGAKAEEEAAAAAAKAKAEEEAAAAKAKAEEEAAAAQAKAEEEAAAAAAKAEEEAAAAKKAEEEAAAAKQAEEEAAAAKKAEEEAAAAAAKAEEEAAAAAAKNAEEEAAAAKKAEEEAAAAPVSPFPTEDPFGANDDWAFSAATDSPTEVQGAPAPAVTDPSPTPATVPSEDPFGTSDDWAFGGDEATATPSAAPPIDTSTETPTPTAPAAPTSSTTTAGPSNTPGSQTSATPAGAADTPGSQADNANKPIPPLLGKKEVSEIDIYVPDDDEISL